MIEEIIRNFILLFILFYILYTVFLNKGKKVYKKDKNTDVRMFILMNDLDLSKTKYKTVLLYVTLINSFILAFASIIIMYMESFIWALLTCFACIMILIYSLYYIVGRSLKRKEINKNV